MEWICYRLLNCLLQNQVRATALPLVISLLDQVNNSAITQRYKKYSGGYTVVSFLYVFLLLLVIVSFWLLFFGCLMQTHKRLKTMLFILTKCNMQIFRVIPFLKLQNNTQTTVKSWKMRCRILSYLLLVDLFCYVGLRFKYCCCCCFSLVVVFCFCLG